MKKTVSRIYFFFLLLIITASAGSAQDRNSITGFVFDDSGRPVTEVYVELLNDVYVLVSRVRVQGAGLYSFKGLPQGVYNVRIATGGTDYEEQTRSVSLVPFSVVQGRGSASEQVDFYLKTRKRSGQNVGMAPPGVVFAQVVPDEAKLLYYAGIQDLAENKETLGLEKIKKSIEVFPEYFLALDKLGNEYLIRGYFEAAFALLSNAVTVNPRSFSSTFGRGLSEFRLGLNDRAIDSFKKSIELNKISANGHLWLGIALHSAQRYSDAMTSLLKANDLADGTSADVHWQLARVYKDQKKFGKAADELELFLKYKPDAENFNEIKDMIGNLRMKI